MRAHFVVVASLLGISVGAGHGCADDDPEDDGGGPVDRTLTIGEGDQDGQGFRALPDGGEAHLRYGTQGGFHVFFAAQVTGFEERRLIFDISAFRDDLGLETPVNRMKRALDVEPVGAEGILQTTQADRFILCPSPSGIGADGKPLRLSVSVSDSYGHTASDEADVVTLCPPDDDRCPPTCAGQ